MFTEGGCVLIRKADVDRALANGPVQGKNLLEPIRTLAKETGLPFKILEDTEVANDAEVHRHEDDLWLCLEGQVTFTYGGELVEPWAKNNPDGTTDEREWKAKTIRGGTTAVMEPGDWLWIPAGQPHQHSSSGTARLVIIKIPKVS